MTFVRKDELVLTFEQWWGMEKTQAAWKGEVEAEGRLYGVDGYDTGVERAVRVWEEMCSDLDGHPVEVEGEGYLTLKDVEERFWNGEEGPMDTVDVVVCPNAGAYIRVPREEGEVATRAIRQLRDRARGILPYSEFKELPEMKEKALALAEEARGVPEAERAEYLRRHPEVERNAAAGRRALAEEAEVKEWLRRHPEVAALSFQCRPIEPMD